MPRVAIATESSCDLPAPLREAAGVAVVPLAVRIGEREFRDGVDLSSAVFARELAGAPESPVVEGPSVEAWAEAFAALAGEAEAVVAVCGSAKLGDGFGNARAAADAVRDRIAVEVVDSRSASMGLGLQVLRAAALARRLPAAAVAERLRAETGRYPVLLALGALDQLRRGGRVGRSAALIGDLLRLKPLLWIDEGQFVPLERARTHDRAVAGLVEAVAELSRPERVAVLHGGDERFALDLADRLAEATGVEREAMIVARLGPAIVAQTGPDAVGVALREAE